MGRSHIGDWIRSGDVPHATNPDRWPLGHVIRDEAEAWAAAIAYAEDVS